MARTLENLTPVGNDGHSIEMPLSTWLTATAVLATVVATTLAAWVRIPLPFTPVPVTMQSFVVLLSAACLGRARGGMAQLLYVAFGSFGLPIFAGVTVAGPYLLGPTGGYIIGFVAAAFFVGHAASRRSDYGPMAIMMMFVAGTTLIFIPGLVWLASWMQTSLQQTVALGLLPFLPGALLKIGVASWIYTRLQRRLRYLFA